MAEYGCGFRTEIICPYRPTRRGESNRLRTGKPKIHRRYVPAFTGKMPRGMAARVVAALRGHDWCRNPDLIELRRIGYTPYSRLFDPGFMPRPMRITPRSESREALSALSMVLAANADYNPDSEWMFEVMMPLEDMARRAGVLHVYENGRKAYDSIGRALRVLEELDYIVVHRAHDSDSGQWKPLRVFLTDRFFTSKGMTLESLRESLHKYRRWAVARGLAESMRERHERHLLKMARLCMDFDKQHKLKNRLRQIKRWVVSPELRAEKQKTEDDLGARLNALGSRRAAQSRVSQLPRWELAWRRWSVSAETTPADVFRLQSMLVREFPLLKVNDPEAWYRLLLERAGVPL